MEIFKIITIALSSMVTFLALSCGAFADEPFSDTELLSRLHHANQMEIQAGTFAQTHAMHADVQSYGKMLVKDHKAADQKVITLADRNHIALHDPVPQNEEDKAQMQREAQNMQRMQMESERAVQGKDPIDRMFLKNMVDDHRNAITMVKSALKTNKNLQIRGLLANLLPKLIKHEQRAEMLFNKYQRNIRYPAGH